MTQVGQSGAGRGVSQQELETRLWAAANSLRGPVDPSDFKAYIFPLLFFKRVSDTWDEEHARAVADFGADVSAEVEADYHRFQLPAGSHWSDLRRLHENVGVGLQNILDRIQGANPEALAGIFGDFQWASKEKLPEHALLNLVSAFDGLDLRPTNVGHDILGAAYEYLLKQFADESGKKAGEFFTPRSVVRLLTRILDLSIPPGCIDNRVLRYGRAACQDLTSPQSCPALPDRGARRPRDRGWGEDPAMSRAGGRVWRSALLRR